MLNVRQFTDKIIIPALNAIDLNSEAAQELLLGTALQESRLTYLAQLGNGPAIGLFQMEPATHDDIWLNYLSYKRALSDKINSLVVEPTPEAMAFDLRYAAIMCRVHYLRVREALPAAGDIAAQAAFWKRYYNTVKGKGTEAEYLENWKLAQ